jgi:ACS family hexuronate transporter-like MFS transporter
LTDQSAPAAPRWWHHRRWWIAILLCAVTTIGYVDRLALAVAAPVIRAEFGFSNAQYGYITLAFLLFYAAGQLLLGPGIDRLGSKVALRLGVIGWSLAAMLHAIAQGVGGFFAARALLGLTEAVNFPAAYKVIAEGFPRAERSLASGFVTAGTGIGAIIAPPLIALLIATGDRLHAAGLSPLSGWHYAFIVPGLLGFLWVAIWQRCYIPPDREPAQVAADSLRAQWMRLSQYLRFRETWGLVLARFTGDGAFYFFAFWIPSYLADARGLSLLQIAWAAALPFVFADVGALGGGWLGQRLVKAGWSVDRSRKTMIWAGALLVPLALPAVYVDSPLLAVLCMGLGVMAIQVKQASLYAVPADLYPAADVASVWGATGAAGSLAAAFAQPVIGGLIDQSGYEPVFLIVASMHLLSAAVFTMLVRRVELLPFAAASRKSPGA